MISQAPPEMWPTLFARPRWYPHGSPDVMCRHPQHTLTFERTLSMHKQLSNNFAV